MQIVMAVTPIEWEIGQDAALTLAPRAIRKWTTQPVSVAFTTAGSAGQTTVTQYKVVRDSDHEDPVRANFATLTHLYAPTWNQGLALGFGLVDNSAEYYFGWSWGLGPRANRVVNLAAGAVYTPVTTLPNGIRENELLDDPAKLKDFTSGHAFRLFVGVTATFFKSGTNAKPQAPAQ